MKTQEIRVIDVFFLAPYLIYLAYQLKGTHRYALLTIAILTAGYNLKNYLEVEKREKII